MPTLAMFDSGSNMLGVSQTLHCALIKYLINGEDLILVFEDITGSYLQYTIPERVYRSLDGQFLIDVIHGPDNMVVIGCLHMTGYMIVFDPIQCEIGVKRMV
jgi:hypothetical protein